MARKLPNDTGLKKPRMGTPEAALYSVFHTETFYLIFIHNNDNGHQKSIKRYFFLYVILLADVVKCHFQLTLGI